MILRHVPTGTLVGRGAPRPRVLADGKTDDGVPFGWCVLEDEEESMEVALTPYLDPPNQAWYYRTVEEASFYDFAHAATVQAVDKRLSPKSRARLREAFPHVGNRVKRYSDPDVDDALVRGMARAGLFDEGVRGWTHKTLPRPDGGVHRRETVVLRPSDYLRTASQDTSSPVASYSPRVVSFSPEVEEMRIPSPPSSSSGKKKKKSKARVPGSPASPASSPLSSGKKKKKSKARVPGSPSPASSPLSSGKKKKKSKSRVPDSSRKTVNPRRLLSPGTPRSLSSSARLSARLSARPSDTPRSSSSSNTPRPIRFSLAATTPRSSSSSSATPRSARTPPTR